MPRVLKTGPVTRAKKEARVNALEEKLATDDGEAIRDVLKAMVEIDQRLVMPALAKACFVAKGIELRLQLIKNLVASRVRSVPGRDDARASRG